MSEKTIGQLFDFTGKTVVVTGGSMGIGYGIAKRFAEAGANVVIADIDAASGEEKVAAIAAEGKRALFVKTDVSSEGDVKHLIAAAVEAFGTIDVFVNNAGIYPSVPVLDMDLALWEKVQAVNGRGVFLCCREAARVMKEKSAGVIINVASVDALHPSMVGLAAYDASKHGVWGFTKNFALEVAKYGIRVNAIAPGGVLTEGVEHLTGGAIQTTATDTAAFAAKIPMGRMAQPDEMATIALFLASDGSSYMTGSIVVADGGVLLA
ncbi:MAG: hypothetical protein A3E38_00840 [Candidatus Moranbacteria bacterium RIFCSPHIGHO2_12_FULL_54_9]|nr:MAG: hypothetical protein A2878_03250 [Candidatus Moranbacteria bacterium RIFCSPHIGHO2_01_FULL_54_31]OGI26098.1 MAG: hypothetical protein A3E38_00840 [Candidatus Moranbacteria bacterium RIFCSPHIGHO2_12_FULL_54_9]